MHYNISHYCIPVTIGVLRGGGDAKNGLRCTKLEVADQQGVVDSRS